MFDLIASVDDEVQPDEPGDIVGSLTPTVRSITTSDIKQSMKTDRLAKSLVNWVKEGTHGKR